VRSGRIALKGMKFTVAPRIGLRIFDLSPAENRSAGKGKVRVAADESSHQIKSTKKNGSGKKTKGKGVNTFRDGRWALSGNARG